MFSLPRISFHVDCHHHVVVRTTGSRWAGLMGAVDLAVRRLLTGFVIVAALLVS
jgi:hypothetical protein